MKVFKYLGIVSLMCFSFLYVKNITNYAISSSALYQRIQDYSFQVAIKEVNAEIKDNYIIPGLSGKSVNLQQSYYKMQSNHIFDPNLLVYNDIKPIISIQNNKDKIINQGNPLKNEVSIIINNNSIEEYMLHNNIKGNVLVTFDTLKKESFFEQVNNDINHYNKVVSFLKNNKLNNELCIYSTMIETLCRVHKKYLIDYTYLLNQVNIVKLKKEVKPGNIYYIDPSASLDSFIILYQELQFKNLNIVYLSELISE